jgi:uncharacterized protein (DUF58 family)
VTCGHYRTGLNRAAGGRRIHLLVTRHRYVHPGRYRSAAKARVNGGNGSTVAAADIDPGDVTDADGAQARFLLVAERWGRRRVGTMRVVVRDRWRLTEGHLSMALPVLDCFPGSADQKMTVVLRRLPNLLGDHPARVTGEGAEFFGVREYLPGDRQRSINWAASTRRGRLQVNTFATERAQDVVLLADATSDVGEPGSSAHDLAFRGAAAAARAYLAARDRVGVITYQGGGVSWLSPRLGRRQLYRIIVSMMTSRPLASTTGWARGASFGRLPRAALPPGALIVVFSPLLDERFVEPLRNIRERSFTMLASGQIGAGLLGAGGVLWAATPLRHTGLSYLALLLASVGVAAGVLRLALAGIPVPEDSYLLTGARRGWLKTVQTVRLVPWEEGAAVATLALEVLHPARPWHTAMLGAALIAYLQVTHLAESGASVQALRPQTRVLAAGAALLALGAGAGMVPAAGPGASSALLRLAAAAALIAAAGLVLPYVARPAPPPAPGRPGPRGPGGGR